MEAGGGDDGWEVVAQKPKKPSKPQSKPEVGEASSKAPKQPLPPQPQQPPKKDKAEQQQQQRQQWPLEVDDTAVRIGGLAVTDTAAAPSSAAPASTTTQDGATAAAPAEAPAPVPAPAPAPVPAPPPAPKKQFSSWAAMAKDNVPARLPAPAAPAPPAAPPTAAVASAASAPTMNGGGAASSSAHAAVGELQQLQQQERRPTVDEVVNLLSGMGSPSALATAMSLFPRRHRGLVNTGNACFRNVILQALLACAPFHALLRRLRPLVLLHPPPHLRPACPDAQKREADLCGLIPTWLSLARLATALDDPGLVASDAAPPPVVLNGKGGKKAAQKAAKAQPQPKHGGPGGLQPPLNPDDYLGECFAAFRSSEAGEQQDPHDFSSFLLNRLHEEAAAAMKAREGWVLDAAEAQPAVVLQAAAVEEEEEDDGWQEVGKKGTVAKVSVSGVQQAGAGGGGAKKFEASAVTRIFYGRQRSDLRRSTGSKNVSATLQPSESLQLGVTPAVHSLEDALAALFAEETVAPTPGSRSSGYKKRLVLDALPPVLLLQLKRFAFDPQRLQPIKVTKPVDYPPTLTLPGAYLSPALRAANKDRDPRYALFAVVLHHGRMVTGGHYTAYCRWSQQAAAAGPGPGQGDGGWFVYDDERVEEASEAQARRNVEQAYLFFYVRTEEDEK